MRVILLSRSRSEGMTFVFDLKGSPLKGPELRLAGLLFWASLLGGKEYHTLREEEELAEASRNELRVGVLARPVCAGC